MSDTVNQSSLTQRDILENAVSYFLDHGHHKQSLHPWVMILDLPKQQNPSPNNRLDHSANCLIAAQIMYLLITTSFNLTEVMKTLTPFILWMVSFFRINKLNSRK